MKQFQLKKWMTVAAALGTLSVPATSMAGTAAQDFSVTINLTAACSISTPTTLVFDYQSMQTSASTPTSGGGFTVTCATNLPFTFGLVEGAGGTGSGTASITPPADPTLNLVYTLNAPAGGTGNGTPLARSITGSIGAGQAGTCATGICSVTRVHTLVVSY